MSKVVFKFNLKYIFNCTYRTSKIAIGYYLSERVSFPYYL